MLVVNHQANSVETKVIISEQNWLSEGVGYTIVYDYYTGAEPANPSGNRNLKNMRFLDALYAELYNFGFKYDENDNLISQGRLEPGL